MEQGGKTWFLRPNGTGPFKLKEYRHGERLVLENNPNYHLGAVHLDTVTYLLGGGSSTAMYEAGEIDVSLVGLADLSRVLEPNEPLNEELVELPASFTLSFLGVNTTTPPFDDEIVRRAFTHAIDKESIASEVLLDFVRPAYGVLPPGFPGFNPDLQGLRFDPSQARQLLRQSRYGDPTKLPRITFTVPAAGGQLSPHLDAIIGMWKQNLGVTVEVRFVEFATFLQELDQKTSSVICISLDG